MLRTGDGGWRSSGAVPGAAPLTVSADEPCAPAIEIPQETHSSAFLSHAVWFVAFPLPQDPGLPCGNSNPSFFCPVHLKHEKLIFLPSLLQLSTYLEIVIMSSAKCSFFRINSPNSFNLSSDVSYSGPLINSIAFLAMH